MSAPTAPRADCLHQRVCWTWIGYGPARGYEQAYRQLRRGYCLRCRALVERYSYGDRPDSNVPIREAE